MLIWLKYGIYKALDVRFTVNLRIFAQTVSNFPFVTAEFAGTRTCFHGAPFSTCTTGGQLVAVTAFLCIPDNTSNTQINATEAGSEV